MEDSDECIAFDETVVKNDKGLYGFNVAPGGGFKIDIIPGLFPTVKKYLTVENREEALRRASWRTFSSRLYTGTGSNPTPTNIRGSGEYLDLGDLVYVIDTYYFTGPVPGGAGPIKFSTPKSARPTENDPIRFACDGFAHLYDVSTGTHYSFSLSGTDRSDGVTIISGFSANGVQLGITSPVTIANGDCLSMTYCYRTYGD